MMKFVADMGISPKTVSFLQDLGYQAVHLHHQGLDRLTDSEVLEKALREESILLTHDLDFGGLLAASGGQLPSVIIFRLRNMRPEQVNVYLHNVITHHSEALDHGVIVTIAEAGVRIRHLPISAPK
jgi:predicted nuclease of predicted toxin-antitoxin system